MRIISCTPALLFILITSTYSAFAEVSINGFASIRATSSDQDGDTPAHQGIEGNGELSFKDESLFALQARADMGDGLSATIQIVAEGKNNFNLEASRAYISYELTPNHRISAGRFANPLFYQSEFENVGYAYNFARLPKSVYQPFEFNTIDGITLDSDFTFGQYALTTKILYGSWEGDFFEPLTGETNSFGLDDIVSLRANFSGGWWNIYGGVIFNVLDGGEVDTDVIFAAAQPAIDFAISQGATDVEVDNFLNAIKYTGKDGRYSYLGFNIDKNDILIDFEITRYGIKDSVDVFNQVWYASLGYRVTPEITILVHTEEFTQDNVEDKFLSKVNNQILFDTGIAFAEAFREYEFKGSGVTLRHDFHPNAALKVDYFLGEDSRTDVGDFSIWSVGIDLIF
ncbi:hypothetical protein [Aliiglaciecola sp. M165]|uniref:hypothetical protein n=1 Tax=Aliiglaciecola sp. M165 TaxID=2593649 RepID=UPI0011812694|nr:hypothetical protein [Aliiglaciecola sp. M165]TRY31407.1 hypothetical protein FM019_11065 [Aliiglaciecola sp. M165]